MEKIIPNWAAPMFLKIPIEELNSLVSAFLKKDFFSLRGSVRSLWRHRFSQLFNFCGNREKEKKVVLLSRRQHRAQRFEAVGRTLG